MNLRCFRLRFVVTSFWRMTYSMFLYSSFSIFWFNDASVEFNKAPVCFIVLSQYLMISFIKTCKKSFSVVYQLPKNSWFWFPMVDSRIYMINGSDYIWLIYKWIYQQSLFSSGLFKLSEESINFLVIRVKNIKIYAIKKIRKVSAPKVSIRS